MPEPVTTPEPTSHAPQSDGESSGGFGRALALGGAVLGSLAVVGVVLYALDKSQVEPLKEYEYPEEVVASGPPPKMVVVGGTTHNFGEMSPNEEDSHTFLIRNEGEGPLELEGGPSTCKCTLSDLKEKVLQPGEEYEVVLTYTPKGENAEWRQTAMVLTNEPGKREVLLEVTGAVLRELFVQPEGYWNVGPVSEGSTPVVGGHIFSSRRDDLEIVEVVKKPDWVSVEWGEAKKEHLEAAGARSGQVIELTINSDMPVGQFTGDVEVRTNIEAEQIVTLGVNGSRAGPVTMFGKNFTASKMLLELGNMKSSEGEKRVITMLIEKDAPFDMVDYTASEENVSIDWKKDETFSKGTRDRYILTVNLEPGIKPAQYTEEEPIRVDIETTNPDLKTLPLTITARILR